MNSELYRNGIDQDGCRNRCCVLSWNANLEQSSEIFIACIGRLQIIHIMACVGEF